VKSATGAREKISKLPAEEFGQYFLLLSALVRTLGCNGLVILLDEVELLAALGVASRAKAYFNLASLMGMGESYFGKRTYTVLFVASGFYSDVLVEREEAARVRSWALENMGEEATGRISDVLDIFLTERIELKDLSGKDIQALLSEITQLHSVAYDWEAKLDPRAVLEATRGAPLRTVIRGTVEWLDLLYLYGDHPSLAVGSVQSNVPTEDEELFYIDESATDADDGE
jgi:hypothetical protein